MNRSQKIQQRRLSVDRVRMYCRFFHLFDTNFQTGINLTGQLPCIQLPLANRRIARTGGGPYRTP